MIEMSKKSSKNRKTRDTTKPRNESQKITVEGEGIDVEYIHLSPKQANKIMDEGISESDLDDLLLGSSTESGVRNAMIMVGGKVVGKFSLDDFKPKKVHKLGGRKAWFLMKEQTERGTFREFLIDKPFITGTLECSASFYELNGFNFGYLEFAYGHSEGEFGETTPRHGGGWEVLSPDGKRQSFDILDDDADESDEVTLELSCPSKDSFRNVCAMLADGWEITTRKQVNGRKFVLLVFGTKGVLEAVDQIVRREKQEFGIVKTRLA
jgi:hypothetical protein